MRGIVRYKFSTTPNTYSNLFRFPPSLSALGTHFRCLGEMCRSFRRSRVCQGSVEGCSRLYRLYFDVQESSGSHQWVITESSVSHQWVISESSVSHGRNGHWMFLMSGNVWSICTILQVLGDLAVAGKLSNIMLHRLPQACPLSSRNRLGDIMISRTILTILTILHVGWNLGMRPQDQRSQLHNW